MLRQFSYKGLTYQFEDDKAPEGAVLIEKEVVATEKKAVEPENKAVKPANKAARGRTK